MKEYNREIVRPDERVGERDKEPEFVLNEIGTATSLLRKVKRKFTPEDKDILRRVLETALRELEGL